MISYDLFAQIFGTPTLPALVSHFFRCIKSFFWADSGGGHVVWHQRRHQ